MNNKLGKLKKIELRTQWTDEARDFTPWLSTEENISLLGEALDIDLEVIQQEKNVGPFRADILCRNTIDDHYVLVENQLEKTDHIHLGQLLTYAAGLDAVTIVWISPKFTEEHRAALDWLNEMTDEKINFFGVQIELYQIGDSLPAPKFDIVSKPNDWKKSVQKSATEETVTETKLLQQEYWIKLKEYLENSKSILKPQKPGSQHWTNFAIGRSYFHLAALLNSREKRIAVILCLSGPNSKQHFNILKDKYFELSKKELGSNIEWRELPDRQESHVYMSKNSDPLNKSDWMEQIKWMKENLERFYSFFSPKVKNISLDEYTSKDAPE